MSAAYSRGGAPDDQTGTLSCWCVSSKTMHHTQYTTVSADLQQIKLDPTLHVNGLVLSAAHLLALEV